MKILVINAGSSSLKYQLFDMDTGAVMCKGLCENIGVESSRGKVSHAKPGMEKKYVYETDLPDHSTAFTQVLNLLTDATYGVLTSVDEIGAVGHRIVHGGEKLTVNVVGQAELDYLHEITPINPLHAPAAIAAITACQRLMPGVKHVVVADNAFYRTLPEEAYTYALPYEIVEKHHIRRYGFHGTSHRYVSGEAAKYLGRDLKDLKMVTCHLGSGSSFSAMKDGVCVDTTMGFTPQEGIMMGTRTGSIDPTIVPYLMRVDGYTPEEMDTILTKKSGFLGMTGMADCRKVMEGEAAGDHRCALAMKVFYHQAKKIIGSLVAELNGCDALVFTAGIGENDPVVRANICCNMDYLGIAIDEDKNAALKRGTAGDITAPGAKTKVLVIPTDEEFMIAKETLDIVTK
ncbi:MAG: acetate/propionate family kinase [Eubacteriales bacterium]